MHSFLNAATDRSYLTTVFKKQKVDLVVMETCGPSGWINGLAQRQGLKTIVCSTNEDAWKWSNVKRKTDKDDALKLARMASMNELKPVHMPCEQHREFRSLVKYRKVLDQRIIKMKCTIRAWFVTHGISIDSGEKAWHTGRERINSFRKSLAECGKRSPQPSRRHLSRRNPQPPRRKLVPHSNHGEQESLNRPSDAWTSTNK